MKTRRNRMILVWLGVLVALMFLLSIYAPGWAAPSQSPMRQTVPVQLTPWAYLPVVMTNHTP
jgi:hypothetical protein